DDETNDGNYECNDGVDNDGDVFIDRDDPLCDSPTDDHEEGECNDGIDNDLDLAIDYPDDFSCSDLNDDDETHPLAECQDGIDNDLDGDIDYPNDLGCDSYQDDDESDGPVLCYDDLDCGTSWTDTYCSGLDFYIDDYTPTCYNPGSERSYCNTETDTNTDYCDYICDDSLGCDYTECSDSVDNDFDTFTDYPDDWGCTSYFDDDETNDGNTECTDGIDNDGDVLIDMLDPGCDGPWDDSEDEPAIWNPLDDQSILEDSPDNTLIYNDLNLECNDPDDPEIITITSTHNHYDLVFNGDNLEIINLELDYTGIETVDLDCNGVAADFDLTVLPENDAPVISGLPDEDVFEDTVNDDVFNLNDYTDDPDNLDSELIYTLMSVSNSNQCGISIDNSDNVDIVPDLSFIGSCTAVVRAEDPTGLFSEDTFVVNVLFNPLINHGPYFISTPVTQLVINDPRDFVEKYEYDSDAIDPDSDPLVYSIITGPAGMTIDPVTGLIEWEPDEDQAGENHVIIMVSDGFLTDLQEFIIDVIIPDAISSPRRKLFIDRISFDGTYSDKFEAGSNVQAVITMTNNDYYDIKEMTVTYTIPELGVRRKLGPFGIDAKTTVTKLADLEIPDWADPGIYDVRISIASTKSDDLRRVRHRELEIY
ncbi:MAG: hypothetical protein ABII01_05105, partial [Candidatus Woesearchaeota archaeon]